MINNLHPKNLLGCYTEKFYYENLKFKELQSEFQFSHKTRSYEMQAFTSHQNIILF